MATAPTDEPGEQQRARVTDLGGGSCLDDTVEEVLGLLRQAVAEVELSASNVKRFLGDAESLVRGLAGLGDQPRSTQ